MNYLKLSKDKLDLNTVNDLIVHESCGGVSFFVGTTRDNFEEKQVNHFCKPINLFIFLKILFSTLKQVTSLEYEAYESMALNAMGKICDQLRNTWPDIKHIAIYHRLGLVLVKEASVIIGVSSPHRQTSLEAVQFAIDAVKQSVPIWKKEQYNDIEGTSAWKENKECSWSNCS